MKQETKYVLNGLIIFYLCVIYFSGVPESNTLNFRLKEKATKVALMAGIWPSWSMFAPNPIRFDSKSYVEIKYKSGLIKEYDIEKEPTGILAPFRKARWMKYAQDNLRDPGQRGLLKPAIKHFARKYKVDNDPMTAIKIKRKWSEVHPFSDKEIYSISKTPRKTSQEDLISINLER